jgi:hypothetical protein
MCSNGLARYNSCATWKRRSKSGPTMRLTLSLWMLWRQWFQRPILQEPHCRCAVLVFPLAWLERRRLPGSRAFVNVPAGVVNLPVMLKICARPIAPPGAISW